MPSTWNVSATTNLNLQSKAPFHNWTDMRPGDGYGYVNPIQRIAADKLKLADVALGLRNTIWNVSAADSIALADQSSNAAQRIYGVSALTKIALADVAAFLHNTIWNVSASNHLSFADRASLGASRVWVASAFDSLNLSVKSSQTATRIYLVSAITSVSLSGSSFLIRTWQVSAHTTVNLSLAAYTAAARFVSASSSVNLAGAGFKNRSASASATSSVGLSVSESSNGFHAKAATGALSLSGLASALKTNPISTAQVQFHDLASAYSILPSGTVISGGDAGVGPTSVLSASVSGRFPFTFAETPEGLVLAANGIDPVISWDGLAGIANTVGLQAPSTPIALAGMNVGTITGARYAFSRFLDANGRPSNLSPISNLVNFGRDGLVDQITVNTATGLITVTSRDHALIAGEQVIFQGVGGIPIVNGTRTVGTVIDKDTFTISDIELFSGAWTEGGSWTWGIATIVYQNVPRPTDLKASRRQILRNLEGSADCFYVDVDTTDLTSTTFYSSLSDEALAAQESVALEADDGTPLANLFTPPPSHKSVLAAFLGRIFAAVDVPYSDGCAVPVLGQSTIRGIGTHWRANWAGRFLYVDGSQVPSEILSVNESTQVATLTAPYAGQTEPYALYTISPAPAERKLVYYSEPPQVEFWPPWNAFAVPEDGDTITGLVAQSSYLYVVERRHIYRYTHQRDPGSDGFVFLVAERGSVNHRCIVKVEGKSYMLDEAGVHVFDGQASEAISEPIQNLFYADPVKKGVQLDWSADRTLWHAAHDPVRATLRWFVPMVGFGGIYHAICFDYRHNHWWVEQYPTQITASVTTDLAYRRSLVGSESRKVLCLSEGALDYAANSGTVSGTVTSATSTTLTDSTATFAPNLNGVPVSIVSGTGVGQQGVIATNTSTTLTTIDPWFPEIPDQTSGYQVGGVNWTWKSGWNEFSTNDGSETESPRDIVVIYRPLTNPAIADLEVFWDHSPTPNASGYSLSQDGVTAISGDPRVSLNLQARDFASGYSIVRASGHGDGYAYGERFVQIQISGTQTAEPVQIYQIDLRGVIQSAEAQG